MDNLIVATNAVVPFIVYLFAGFICAKSGLVKEEFLRTLNGFVFKAFFPFIMFNNLYDVDFSSLGGSVYVLFAVAMTVAVILSAALIVPRVVKDDSRRGVIIQASFRSNTILYAIPLVESVFGEAGAVKASILVAFIVPLYNIVSVVVLEKYRGGRVSAAKLLTNILKNPLIIGAIAGIIFNALPITMPSCLATPVSAMAGMATPLSLIVLGGTLKLSSMRSNIKPLAVVTFTKLIAVPAICVILMSMLHFEAVEFFVVFCTFATPVAAASYPMAQSMGGDARLAGEYVVVTTLTSLLTIFVWILVLKNLCLI